MCFVSPPKPTEAPPKPEEQSPIARAKQAQEKRRRQASQGSTQLSDMFSQPAQTGGKKKLLGE